MTYIIDENVPIVANDVVRKTPRSPQADLQCQLDCIQVLERAIRSGIVVIDDQGEVLLRYRKHLQSSGQPGVGDAFLKHVSDRQFDIQKVRRISLAPNEERSFEAFPAAKALKTFDPGDRIYVALVRVAGKHATLLNAVDSDYSEHEEALAKAGIDVRELCPHCLKKVP